ncbi:hypothetical protein HB825_05450 [Listeria booriae]|uniref:hypothetical protein n=1 Tax=Listeria booriae TaxID=1552123 RepID=UPI00164D9AE1|nr:hypothetical protein [Listeria booriae]MBC6134282.1 hypothetical protein [Listeria booriae]
MRTSEFKTMLDEMDLAVYESESAFIITEDELNWDIANVSKDYERIMSIEEHAYEAIGSGETCELFELLTAYASTPLDEREEPKKYYVKCPITGQYLNKSINNQNHWWTINCGDEAMYTRAEIDAFEFEHDHLIEDEVKNDDK